MTLTADVSVPHDALTLGGKPLRAGLTVEFETVVPVGGTARVLFWVEDDDAFDRWSDGGTDDRPARVDAVDGRVLYQDELGPEAGPIVEPIREDGVHIVAGVGDADGWRFRLLCADRRSLSEFSVRVTDRGVPVTLDRIRRDDDRTAPPLSTEQQTAVLRALDGGYFDIPRRTTILDLAESEGISDSAFSQRLRRGLRAVLEESRTAGLLRDGGR
ncbi:helix-turn-helix domain-containing protein [Halosimplex litoreum]|uniref:Helix-turn-helix domain-containing protein n=1 Tax=Halosimplex litoreum TaxID=1198301 RepID=A0A7T3FXX6_9EURY|nr:helix-turn-helix domain-containing protein [Halosimplex litoreum]QPV62763.1 helix-turn-helix domain-containing protein [Halosimplex litoreum]